MRTGHCLDHSISDGQRPRHDLATGILSVWTIEVATVRYWERGDMTSRMPWNSKMVCPCGEPSSITHFKSYRQHASHLPAHCNPVPRFHEPRFSIIAWNTLILPIDHVVFKYFQVLLSQKSSKDLRHNHWIEDSSTTISLSYLRIRRIFNNFNVIPHTQCCTTCTRAKCCVGQYELNLSYTSVYAEASFLSTLDTCSAPSS